jgi:hypothetical protein
MNIYFINRYFLGVKVEFPQVVVGGETWLTWALVNVVVPWLGFWFCGGRVVCEQLDNSLVSCKLLCVE